jgi:hypothetical protein
MEHERQWALKMEHEKWKIGSKWKTRDGECAEVIAYCDALICPLLMRIKNASFGYYTGGSSAYDCWHDIVGPWEEEPQELKIEVGHIYQLANKNGIHRAYIKIIKRID